MTGHDRPEYPLPTIVFNCWKGGFPPGPQLNTIFTTANMVSALPSDCNQGGQLEKTTSAKGTDLPVVGIW